MINLAIIGASGRMGCALIRAASDWPTLRLVSAVVSATSPALGRDAGELAGTGALGVLATSDLSAALTDADVAVDFSKGQATQAIVTACERARVALLVGTTGHPELESAFAAASNMIPLLVAPNTSVGSALLLELVREAARMLPAQFDIEVIEAHHRGKRDAPSGTALALARAAAEAGGRNFDPSGALPSDTAPRRFGEIAIASIRAGDIVGEHTVLFAGSGERLSLTHAATDRAIFAHGALRAAAWLASKPPGRYFMRDVIRLES